MSTARDLALDANYDLAVTGQDLTALVADADAITSDVEATLLFMLGEWFADKSQGISWFQKVLGQKNPSLAAIRAELFKAIAARQGISQVLSVSVSANNAARTASVTWTAQSDAGLLGSTVPVSP